MKRIWLLLVLILIMGIAAGCATSPNEGKVAPKQGAIALDFTLTNTDGVETSLSSQRGKVVLINFWASWCPPCLQEMPDISSRARMYQDSLTVLAVNDGDPADIVVQFRSELGLSFAPLIDARGSVSNSYQVNGLPTSMFVDEHGIIQIVHIGLMTASQLDKYLAQMGLPAETSSN